MFKKITILVHLFFITFAFSQTVSTVTAGNFYDAIGKDSQGNIYCSNFIGDSVFKYDVNGNVTTFKSGFTNPNGIDVNEQDEIFICSKGSNTVYRYDINGTEIASYTMGINNPTGIKNIAGTTDMLLVEYENSTLKKLELDGTVTTLFSGFPLNGPSGIAFVNGTTYISNFNDRKIMRYENGTMTLVTQLPETGANNNFLGFLAASNNTLYATQLGEHQIYSIDPVTGNAIVYAGSTGGGNTDGDISIAQFNFPNGILADTVSDRIYISDAGSSNLRIINNASLSVSDVTINSSNLKLVVDKLTDSINIAINLISNDTVNLKIFEISGKEVFKKDYSISNLEFSKNINTANLQSGVYVILFIQNDRLISKKVIL